VAAREEHVMNAQELIPIRHFSLDLPEPLAGWEQALTERGVVIVHDDLGRPSVPREVLGELIAEHREREARVLEDQQRLSESVDSRPLPGWPAIDGSPYEAMVAAGGVILPSQEFGARPKPDFLVEELEATARMKKGKQ
jgi:hypothetical protein